MFASADLPSACRIVSSATIATATCLALYALVHSASVTKKPRSNTPAPASAEKARLPPAEDLPYPSDALPGARLVDSPYGTVNVFEWGPEAGEKVLLLHGIGTPCIALGDMAEELARNGYRVMLFDLFGRGYSDAPQDVPYDDRLYTSQILLALASSRLPWTGADAFHLMGYSLGGALAASFAAHHAHLLRSVTLVCPGGLIRPSHLGWRSRLLFSRGLLPECVRLWLLRRRLEPRAGAGAHVPDEEDADLDFDDVPISRQRRAVTVGHVVKWQLTANPGFVGAYMSTICHAPIYGEHDGVWRLLRDQLRLRRAGARAAVAAVPPGLPTGKICLILAEKDPIVVKDEWIEDSREVLGAEAVDVHVMKGGHEIAIARGKEVAQLAMQSWGDNYLVPN